MSQVSKSCEKIKLVNELMTQPSKSVSKSSKGVGKSSEKTESSDHVS